MTGIALAVNPDNLCVLICAVPNNGNIIYNISRRNEMKACLIFQVSEKCIDFSHQTNQLVVVCSLKYTEIYAAEEARKRAVEHYLLFVRPRYTHNQIITDNKCDAVIWSTNLY